MRKNKITLIVLFLVLVSIFILPGVLAQDEESGPFAGIQRASTFFWGSIDAFFTPDFLKSDKSKLGFIRFSFFVLVFTIAHFSLSKIPNFSPRHVIVVALIVAGFVFLIPGTVIKNLGAAYMIGVIFFLSFGLLFAILYASWIMPQTTMPGRIMRVALIFFGLMLVLYVRGTLDGIIDDPAVWLGVGDSDSTTPGGD